MVVGKGDSEDADDTLIQEGSLVDLMDAFLDRTADDCGEGGRRMEEEVAEGHDTTRVRAACILWDLCANRQHAESLLKIGLLGAVRKVLCEEDLEEQRRLAEVVMGMLGNLSTHRHVRQAMLEDDDGRTVICAAVQWFVLWADWATLREFCRFMALLSRELGGRAAAEEPSPSEEHMKGGDWLEGLLACEAFVGKLLFALKNSLDPEMLSQAWHLAYTACYHSPRLWAVLDMPLLEQAVMESFQGSLREELPNCRVDALCGLEYCLRTLEVHVSRVEESGVAPRLSPAESHRRKAGQSALLASLEGVLLDDSLSLALRTSGGLVLADLLDLLSSPPGSPYSQAGSPYSPGASPLFSPAPSPLGQLHLASPHSSSAAGPSSPPTPTSTQSFAEEMFMSPSSVHCPVRVVLPTGTVPRASKGQGKALFRATTNIITSSLVEGGPDVADVATLARLSALLPLCVENSRYSGAFSSCQASEHSGWASALTTLLLALDAHPQLASLDADDVACIREAAGRAGELLQARMAPGSPERAQYGALCRMTVGP